MSWFYKTYSGMELGPVSPQELLELIRSGNILSDTPLKKDDSQWVQAKEVNGLWDMASKPSKAYYCNECGKQISRPPCRCEKCDRYVERATEKLVSHDLAEVERRARKALSKAKVPKLTSVATGGGEVENRSSTNQAHHLSASSSAQTQNASGSSAAGERKWLSWLRKRR
jgi:hypothetical protein